LKATEAFVRLNVDGSHALYTTVPETVTEQVKILSVNKEVGTIIVEKIEDQTTLEVNRAKLLLDEKRMEPSMIDELILSGA
jgi:hypothetical protein